MPKEAIVINPSAKLKTVQHKVIWGGRSCHRVHSSNLVTLVDNEFVTLSGSGLLLFENGSVFNRKTKIIDCKDMNILCVKTLTVTKDGKYLAALVKLTRDDSSEINILIFHTAGHFQDMVKPRTIRYSGAAKMRPGEILETTAIAFSHDSMYLAVATSIPSIGILIYEQFKGTIFQTVVTDSIAVAISFHPADANKLLGTGDQNLINFWKFTSKSVHLATVAGLKRGNNTYTAHGWVAPYAENTIVVGTSNGFVTTIQNCEQRVAAQQIFASTGNNPVGCLQMLIRGDHVIVSSTRNYIVLFELRRIVIQKFMGLTCVMVPLKFYAVNDISRICGLQFCFKDSITAYSMVATTEESVVVLDMISDSDLSGAGLKKNDGHPDQQDSFDLVDWMACTSSKTITKFHNGSIQSLSLASRAKIFVTSSFQDGSVRCWYYDDPSSYNYPWLVENYRDRMDENPFHVDMHPSGLYVAYACENEVREYAVCDNSFDIVRRFLIRNAFQGPNGAPVIINQPVSLVRYSQGAHLIAVVTGKVAQIFHLYHHDDDAPSGTSGTTASAVLGPIDNPYRIMVLLDHANPITDITFFNDDKGIITTASDGSVYSWELGANQRSKEFLHKGIAATHVAVSKHFKSRTTIIASFENLSADAMPIAAEIIKRRRLSSFAIRKISSSGSAYSDGGDSRGSRNSNDLAVLASNFLREFEGKFAAGSANTPDGHSKPTTAAPIIKPFIAIWNDDISINPKIIQVESPVRSIAIGRAGYPDPYDFCALGLADGRIIISMLPIPFIEITSAVSPVHSISISATSTVTNHKLSSAMRKKRGLFGNSPSRSEMIHDGTNSPIPRSRSAMADEHFSGTNPNFQEAIQVFGTGGDIRGSALGLMVPNQQNNDEFPSGGGSPAGATVQHSVLDDANCKILRIAVGSITNVAFSTDGSQVIATAEDGSVHLLTTVKKFTDFGSEADNASQANSASTAAASGTNNPANSVTAVTNSGNHFFMVDRSKMTTIRAKLVDLEGSIEQSKKDFEMQMNKVLEHKDKHFHETELRLKKEIHKRDETIVTGRREYLTMRKEMQQEIENLQKYSQEALSTMEMNYEKRLSQEALYLEKMKQAYDEYVVHAKLDMIQLHQQTDVRVGNIELEKKKLMEDIEKQKTIVLKYYDYVKDRNMEILSSLEEQQADERLDMKSKLTTVATRLAEAQALNMTQEVQASRMIQRLKVDIEHKEMEIMRVNSDIDWANDRIQKLEQALTQATTEVKARSEVVERSEGKMGELQQKIDDLERIRKTLTTQVHLLQSQLDPKEKELSKVREKMHELTREYDISLHAITEKEASLTQKNENLALLQKQVRELRTILGQREAALRRAATFLDEFIYACHAEKFNAKKKIPLSVLKQLQANELEKPNKKGEKATAPIEESKATLTVDTAHEETAPVGGGGVGAAQKRPLSSHLAQSKTHDLLTTLNFDQATTVKLKRLEEILKPYIDETKVDAEIISDLEAVQNEQERKVQLLHRNLGVLQSSLESINQAAANKVLNHLVDNQTLLKEVNNLRMEVKALSSENDRLSAFLSSQAAGLAASDFRRRAASPPASRLMSRDASFHSELPGMTRPDGFSGANHTSVDRPSSGGFRNIDKPSSYNNDYTGTRLTDLPAATTSSIDYSKDPLFPPFPKRYDASTIREDPSKSSLREDPSNSSLNEGFSVGGKSNKSFGASPFQLASSNILQSSSSHVLPHKTPISQVKINNNLSDFNHLSAENLLENSSQLSHLSRPSYDSLPQQQSLLQKSSASLYKPSDQRQQQRGTKQLDLNGKTAEEKIAELMNLNLQELRESSTNRPSQLHSKSHSQSNQSSSLTIVEPSLNIAEASKSSSRQINTNKKR